MLMMELTEDNYMQEPKLTLLPLHVTFSGIPIHYLCWKAIIGIANMIGRAYEETPRHGHARRNRGFKANVWFDTRSPLPVGVTVKVANGNKHYLSFLYENLPENYCLFYYTIKYDTNHCPIRLAAHRTENL